MQPYPSAIEIQMQRYYQSLSEKDRHRYLAPATNSKKYLRCGSSNITKDPYRFLASL